jgi:hypothetical protein
MDTQNFASASAVENRQAIKAQATAAPRARPQPAYAVLLNQLPAAVSTHTHTAGTSRWPGGAGLEYGLPAVESL